MYYKHMEHAKDITILIDTTKIREACVTLVDNDKNVIGEFFMEGKSQTILPVLENVLSQACVIIDDITAIQVKTGPGSFTGTRVGVGVAKTLSLLLGIDINGKKPWEPIEILYEKDKFAASPLQG